MIGESLAKNIRETVWDVTSNDIWELSDLEIDNFVNSRHIRSIPGPVLKRWLHDTRMAESRWIVSGSEGALAVFMFVADAISYIEMKAEALQFEKVSAEDVHEYF